MADEYLAHSRSWPLLIAIDGPSGCGKSTLLRNVESLLAGQRVAFRMASNNDSGLWGGLIRSLATNPRSGFALALATAGARAELREAADTPILCDRYALSTFVYQRFAGVPVEYLYAVNAPLLSRSVTFALTITPELLIARRKQRQSSSRDWFKEKFDVHSEVAFYDEAINDLTRRGHDIRRVNASGEIDSVTRSLVPQIANLLRTEIPG
jgi:thymidylate kinase